MNIFKIDEKLRVCLDKIMEFAELNSGEISPELNKEYDSIIIDRNNKIDSYVWIIKEMKYDINALESIINELNHKKKSIETRIEYLRNVLKNTLNGEKFKSITNSIYYINTEKVDIVDENVIPEGFYKIEKIPLKDKIKKSIKSGEEVPGCKIENNISMVIK